MEKRTLIFCLLLILSIKLSAQKKDVSGEVLLQISLNKDSVFFGDTVSINLYFKNNSDSVVYFSNDAKMGLSHYRPNVLISYGSFERMYYSLNDSISDISNSPILQGQTFEITFKVVIKESFFYPEKDSFQLLYNSAFSGDKIRTKRLNKKGLAPLILLSNPIEVVVLPSSAKSRFHTLR